MAETSVPTRIEFVENHRPGLVNGSYRITASQDVVAPGAERDTHFPVEQRFAVYGERFSLNPDDVVAVFPPAGSLGDHTNVLPHIVLGRSTLPWERFSLAGQGAQPWLALLVFAEDEIAATSNIPLRELEAAGPGWPGVEREAAQHPDDVVTIIDVPAALIQSVIPTGNELRYLAHVRRTTDDTGRLQGEERAIVVANRLPRAGSGSVAHLVSLERRYHPTAGGEDSAFETNGGNGNVRFVSLWSWRFTCLSDDHSLENILKRLARDAGPLRLPEAGLPGEIFLTRGYVPCPHYLRGGEKTVSWYHGPLVPANTTEATSANRFPVHTGDALLRYDEQYGMLDAGYAAAWELGRLLALDNSRIAQALYDWRHQRARYLYAERHLRHAHLPAFRLAQQPELPSIVGDWVARLALLYGVPFNYLVPDERMLPVESLRLFTLDPHWLAALFDGAFSIGRAGSLAGGEHALDDPRVAALLERKVSGFIMRSSAVAGWPSLAGDAWRHTFKTGEQAAETLPASDQLDLLRLERLSPNVLLALFHGEPNVIDLHQPAESTHFGVHLETAEDGVRLSKGLRNAAGDEVSTRTAVPQRTGGRLVIDVAALAGELSLHSAQLGFTGSFTGAQFALEMIEGVTKVRLIVS